MMTMVPGVPDLQPIIDQAGNSGPRSTCAGGVAAGFECGAGRSGGSMAGTINTF